MTAATALPEGTKVRVTGQSVSSDAEVNDNASTVGREYLVCYYVDGEGSDDPDGKPYYLLDIEGRTYGGDSWCYPENLEVVQTIAQRAARELPADKQLRNAVSSALLSMSGYDLSAVDFNGDDEVVAYGSTDEGLGFSFVVTISEIEEWDLS